MENSIDSSESKVRELEAEKKLAQADPQKDWSGLEVKLTKEKWNLAWQKWALAWEDAILPRDPFQTICCIMGLLIVSTLIKHLLMLSSDLLIGHVSTNIVRSLRLRVFDSALAMDRKSYEAYGTSGMLAAITAAAESLSAGLMSLFGTAIREPLRIAACLIMACFISWRLLVLSILLAPLLIMVVIYFNRKIRLVASSILERNAGFHEVLLEALNNIFTVQAFTMEKHEKERFSDCTQKMRRMSLNMIFYTGLSKPFTELIGVGMVAITVCAGAYLVVNQKTDILFLHIRDTPLSITELLIFFGLLVGASDPLRKLSGVSIAIYSGAMSANLLYSILESEPTVKESANPIPLAGRHTTLAFQDVSFHYNQSQPILKKIELEVAFGEAIAILGPNGCGKSTLIQLLSRNYDPIEGAVYFDGIDIRDMAVRDIRTRIALVSQSTELFNRTVMENIRYGNPECTDHEVFEAAKQAHAHDFITHSLSDGYQTTVGQAGQRLSGGQRQRIALARAILRKPEILILDESTSQIDMASELQIRETLLAMKRQMTIIIITHREALIAVADKIYHMQSGDLKQCSYTTSAA